MITPEIGRLIDELRSALGMLETVFNAVPYAIVYADARDRVQWCNAAFERLVGRRRIEIIGIPLGRIRMPISASRTTVKSGRKRIGVVFIVPLKGSSSRG